MVRAIPLSFYDQGASFRTYFCAFCRNGHIKLWRTAGSTSNLNQVLSCLECLADQRQITLRAA